MEKTYCEMFAGVGGFSVGLSEGATDWECVWYSQWEPGRKHQWAYECLERHLGALPEIDGAPRCADISTVDKFKVPDFSLLVGGFPCQDYSVATIGAKGIEGKKGVLWWQIKDMIKAKMPVFCIFENVDRLLKSPSSQRGRDFGIILATMNELGYGVEWRVVNAADYGAPQRRRRVFIFCFRMDTEFARQTINNSSVSNIFSSDGFMAKAFPVNEVAGDDIAIGYLPDGLQEVSDTFRFDFGKVGFFVPNSLNEFYSAKIEPVSSPKVSLCSILEEDFSPSLIQNADEVEKWKYLKGAKKFERTAANGHKYMYSEGPVPFPDKLDEPARTILTSEGSISRTSHVIYDASVNAYRKLSVVECERIQGFPDGWTEGMPVGMRYFTMGNALSVPMVARMAKVLDGIILNEK